MTTPSDPNSASWEAGSSPEAEQVTEGESLRTVSKLTFESRLAADEAFNYLSALIRGIQGGSVTLRQGDETLSLAPGGEVDIKVKAAHKGRKEKLEVELSWRLSEEQELEID